MKATPPWSPKCLTFCHTLASQGQAISFSLAIGPDFSFSGHQEQGSTQSGDQEEEAEPLNTPQKCQAQGRICQKEASLFS